MSVKVYLPSFLLKFLNILLQFEGQTKSKLGTPEARNIVDSIVYEKLSYFLEENKEIADNLVKKMIKAAQVRDAARKAREAARKGKGARTRKNFKWETCASSNKKIKRKMSFILSKEILPVVVQNKDEIVNIKQFCL